MKYIFLIISTGNGMGLSSVSSGLVHCLDRNGFNVGFYKPFCQSKAEETKDRSIDYIRSVMHLAVPVAYSRDVYKKELLNGNLEGLLNTVIENTETLLEKYDMVVIEGLIPDSDLPQANELNNGIISSLGAELILVTTTEAVTVPKIKGDLEGLINSLPVAYKRAKPNIILNHVKEIDGDTVTLENYKEKLALFNSDAYNVASLVPEAPELREMRVTDLLKGLNANLLNTADTNVRRVRSIRICARQVENMLTSFDHGALIVTPGDRSDIIVASALAAQKGIELAGIVLTGEVEVKDEVMEFCRQPFMQGTGLPILAVEGSSIEIANQIYNLDPKVPIDDHQRIKLVNLTIARFIDVEWLRTRIPSQIKRRLSPVAFKHNLSRQARKANKTILLPEGQEERTIKAAIDCAKRSIARCILIGDQQKITERITDLGGELGDLLQILDPKQKREHYVKDLYEIRKHKGMTIEQASEAIQDNILLATVMLSKGDADGLVSGAEHTTAHTVRPALQLIKPAPGNSVISSIFFMCLPEQVYIFGDCAINPSPNAEQLAEIAIQSARSAEIFGIPPKIAMISYSTLESGSGADVEKVKKATQIVRERCPELIIDGPLQYDAAITPSVAAKKAPNSSVAGHANVLIFPDLNTGNTTYKAVQRTANVASIGPMLQGLNKPVNDLSRGTSVEDIVYTIALTAIQATLTD